MSKTSNTSTAALVTSLSGRKHQAKMGARLNESVATGPSDFARAQLQKMGWTEGTGLGKHRDGMATHIRVEKRQDQQALGAASVELDPVVTGDQWWKSSVGNTLARLRAKKESKKKKKSKKSSKKDSSSKKRKLEYTDEELFEATGGARFGMRAQTQQHGKWNRAEKGITPAEEETARAQTEWDGMEAPKIVLSSSEKKKKKAKTEASGDSSSEGEVVSEPPRKKRRKPSPSEANDEEKPESSDATKSKKKKKDKKEKKDKKKKKKTK